MMSGYPSQVVGGSGARYELRHVVGRGATAEVWLAWIDGDPDRPVAVKRARSEPAPTRSQRTADARLRGEAAVLAAVSHPHLLPLVELVEARSGIALVVPYLPGGTLRELLGGRAALDAGQVAAVLGPVADALDALHRGGEVHGDLKPDNVLLDTDGSPMLTDVGRAGDPTLLAATPAYLDPAVADDGRPRPGADVFALGAMAYEALTGRLPHRGEPAEILAAARVGLHRPLASWPSVPEPVAVVVEAALDPDPTRRPATAAVFGRALVQAASASGPVRLAGPAPVRRSVPEVAADPLVATLEFRPAHPAPRPRRRGRRLAGPLAAAAGSAVVVGLGLALGLARRPDPPHASTARAAPPARCPSSARSSPSTDKGSTDWADVDGDGCADRARWDGSVLRVDLADGPRAYRLGGRGLQVVLGDWDARGGATPAIYDPETGTVGYVDRLPDAVGERVRAGRVESVRRRGRAEVVASDRVGEPDRVRIVVRR